jgi:hypothetical protein
MNPIDPEARKVALLLTQEQRVYDDEVLDVRVAASGSHIMAVVREALRVMWGGVAGTFTPTRAQRRALAAMSLAGTAAFISYGVVIKNGIEDRGFENVDLAKSIPEVHVSIFGPKMMAAGKSVQLDDATVHHAFAVNPKTVPQQPARLEDLVAAALREAGVLTYEDAAVWFTANGLTGPAMRDALFQHGLYFDDEVGEYRVQADPDGANGGAPTLDTLKALIEELADILYVSPAQAGAMLDEPLEAHIKMTIDCNLGSATRCLTERVAFVGNEQAAVVVNFDSREGGRIRMDDDATNSDEIGDIARMNAADFAEDGSPISGAGGVALASNI